MNYKAILISVQTLFLTATLLFAAAPDDEMAVVRKAVDEGNARYVGALKQHDAEI